MVNARAARSVCVAAVVALSACAGIEYQKVPTPTQYETWSDERQAEADAMEGVRYYLPRPFLHLKQSVPVAQRVAFFSVVYTKENVNGVEIAGYKVEMPQDAPTWVKRALPSRLSVSQVLAATLAAEQQVGRVGDEEEQPGAETQKSTPSTLKATTGFINASDPVTKLGELMDVVYLPDFEEQYVINPNAGLGTSDVETRLRNGWAAEVFTQSVDNSNLIPYVIEQVEKASEAAAGIATTWGLKLATGVSPAELGALRDAGLADMQSGAVGDAAVDFLGETLLFKIAEVKVAQPGLYPILKPREIRQWFRYQGVVDGDPEKAFELFLKASNLPWIRPDMAFVPCPPFTMVGFNVTTDVFLAPATEKVTLQAPDSGGGGQDEEAEAQAEADIAAALFASRADSSEPVISGLLEQNVLAESLGEQTRIELKSPVTAFTPARGGDYKTWIAEALKIQQPTPDTWPAVEFEAADKTAVVIVPLSASNIVELLDD